MDYITLKWGSIKSSSLTNNPQVAVLIDQYYELEEQNLGSSEYISHDTPEQKKLLCDAIDALDGYVIRHWTGTPFLRKEDAKHYIMTYHESCT